MVKLCENLSTMESTQRFVDWSARNMLARTYSPSLSSLPTPWVSPTTPTWDAKSRGIYFYYRFARVFLVCLLVCTYTLGGQRKWTHRRREVDVFLLFETLILFALPSRVPGCALWCATLRIIFWGLALFTHSWCTRYLLCAVTNR